MTIIRKKIRLDSIHGVLFLIAVVLVGCSPTSLPPSDVAQGSSKGEVIALLGEPNLIQEFTLPNEPFFGPQESLVNLVPAGTVIEEWVYEIEDEVFYVWFTGEVDELAEDWLVLVTARYPKDAIY